MTTRRERLGRAVGRFAAIGTVLAVTASATATAQTHGGGGMGGWGGFGGWMIVWPIVLIGLPVLLAVWASGRRGGDHSGPTGHPERADRALAELRERYARGDLSDEEFEQRRRKLQP